MSDRYSTNTKNKQRARGHHLQNRYNLADDYQRMLESQNGVAASASVLSRGPTNTVR
jgi:hypothetical protein